MDAIGRYLDNVGHTLGTDAMQRFLDGKVQEEREAFDRAVEDGTRYSYKDMRKLTWEQQVKRVLSGKAKRDDILVIADRGVMTKYGIDEPIIMNRSGLAKAMRKKEDNSKSAHGISEGKILKLSDAVKDLAAIVENERGKTIVTNIQDDSESYLILSTKRDVYGSLVVTSLHGQVIMPALYATWEGDEARVKPDTVIHQYKKDAANILLAGPVQFRAPRNVADILESISQKHYDVKYSLKDSAGDEYGAMLDELMARDVDTGSSKEAAALVSRMKEMMANRRASEYGIWKAGIAHMADTLLSETASRRYSKAQVERRLTELFEELDTAEKAGDILPAGPT